MANFKKAGIRAGRIAAFLLSVSLFGQTGSAEAWDAQAAGITDWQNTQDTEPETEQNQNAEAGIIEVLSGFVDAKGKFWKMRSGSGFLIANKEHDTYIVTNSSNVSNTPQKIKKFCKKKFD